MSTGRRVLAVLIAIVGTAALTGLVAWAATGYFDSLKSKPAVELVDRYFAGFRDVNLEQVRSTVEGGMMESLPGTQTAFAKMLKNSPDGAVKSWTVTSVVRNDYIGQAIVEVQVATTKGSRRLKLDIFPYVEGPRIRAVWDANNPQPGTASGSDMQGSGAMGSGKSSGSGSGGMGMGGMGAGAGAQ